MSVCSGLTSRVAEVYHGRTAEDNAPPRTAPLLTRPLRSAKISAMRPFVAVVALVLGLVVTVNGLAVWDRARHERRIERAAAAFSSGQALLGYRDTDERRFQKARLAVIPPPRIVVFGSSRVMTISTAMMGAAPGEFYNAGLSGGTVEDFIVMWSTLKASGRIPEVARTLGVSRGTVYNKMRKFNLDPDAFR